MNASRMKAETHWKSVGAAVARRAGTLADLDQVKTGKKVIDAWIIAGYEKTAKPGDALRAAGMTPVNPWEFLGRRLPKTVVTPEIAAQLSTQTGTTPQFWLNMQRTWLATMDLAPDTIAKAEDV